MSHKRRLKTWGFITRDNHEWGVRAGFFLLPHTSDPSYLWFFALSSLVSSQVIVTAAVLDVFIQTLSPCWRCWHALPLNGKLSEIWPFPSTVAFLLHWFCGLKLKRLPVYFQVESLILLSSMKNLFLSSVVLYNVMGMAWKLSLYKWLKYFLFYSWLVEILVRPNF